MNKIRTHSQTMKKQGRGRGRGIKNHIDLLSVELKWFATLILPSKNRTFEYLTLRSGTHYNKLQFPSVLCFKTVTM